MSELVPMWIIRYTRSKSAEEYFKSELQWNSVSTGYITISNKFQDIFFKHIQ